MRMRVKERALNQLQALFSGMMSFLAVLRMRVVRDSGTKIGRREVVFRKCIPKGGVGIELGVYKGTLSKFILEVNQPRILHLVDPWWKYEAHWHWAKGDTSSVRSLAGILLVFQEEIETGQVVLHIGGSEEVLVGLDDDCLDWAYIDSTHSYEQTKRELELLKAKVKSTGIIAGDDWREEESHPHHGVQRAVQEFLGREARFELLYQTGTQWAIGWGRGRGR